ncbi:MAG TPA: type I 3-dehydroquinate dehydratase [Candidatus Poseidoniaceae archaeon]|nr:type I 3-dehydroquinate dehydratase [Candidatus Poseidoniaceae archaeon]
MAEPKVCVTLEAITVEEMIDEATRANIAGADYVEVRFDKLYLNKPEPIIMVNDDGEEYSKVPPIEEWGVKDFDEIDVEKSIATLKEGIPVPVVFTTRAVREGGFFAGTEEERLQILEQGIKSEVSFIDLELSIESKARDKLVTLASGTGCKVIASIHETKSTPNADEIVTIVKDNSLQGDIVKFCSTVSNHQDALQIFQAANSLVGQDSTHSLMGLGNGGDWVRLHAPVLEQAIVYATMMNHFRLSDRGLINVRDLRDAWALMEY